MGFSFRKSIKLGPLRVNLSKSGIGLSAGVRGARVSKGPRGTYLNVGTGGVQYRKKLDGTSEREARVRRGGGGASNWLVVGLAALVVLLLAAVLLLSGVLLSRIL